MSKKKSQKTDWGKEIRSSFQLWQKLKDVGGSDPFWPDGANMNLVRNHIISHKRQCEEAKANEELKEFPEEYYLELPPIMDDQYMARKEEIMHHALQSFETLKKDPDFQYVKKNAPNFSEKDKSRFHVDAVLGYVSGLERYIQEQDYVGMRRMENPDRYLDSFRVCRKQMEEAANRELPPGQISLFDLFRASAT